MAADTLAVAFSLAGSLVGLLLALELWHRTIVLRVREEAFRIRADLFDVALTSDCFDDEAYRHVRQRINGFLRLVDDLTGLRILAFLVSVAVVRDKPNTSIPALDKSPIRETVLLADRKLGRLVRLQTFMGTPSGLLLMSLLFAIGQLRRVFRAVIAHLVRLGGDDDYARQERDGQWWQSRDDRGNPAPPGVQLSG